MKTVGYFLILILLNISCSLLGIGDKNEKPAVVLKFGGDFSMIKKMEDAGGLYKTNGVVKEGFELFQENGYKWARLRLLHTPSGVGPACNSLDYTIESAKLAKRYGFKILINIQYSDLPTNPGHQTIPVVWKNCNFTQLQDSIKNYTKSVIEKMGNAGVLPDMVQIGNEINNGMLWPYGKLWIESGITNWNNLSLLLTAGINGVKEAKNGASIPIMIHAANGGDVDASYNFYKNIIDQGVKFDVIGISYFPWWHGTFIELESNILFLSSQFTQDFSIVETAYYSNGWYPEPSEWFTEPFEPNERGQNSFLVALANIMKQHPRVKTIFYCQPDILDIPETKIEYNGRSLFNKNGDAFMGISAWKEIK